MNDKAGSTGSAQPGADIGAEDVEAVKDEGAQPAAMQPAGVEPVAAALAERASLGSVIESLRDWWAERVIGQVDQAEVIERRRDDCAMSERYLFMTAMSGGIAVLGLLLGSPAVVIGAMLLSPLMGPIMGLGFALAIGDWDWVKQSARTLLLGSLLAVLLCGALVYLSPIQTITTEIAARTRPNLFDLFVALFSALAGAYAMIRGREGTIVGVAIATALMPPLAVVGFGLATFNWTVFSGSLLLFVTNLLTIALTAFAMAKLYGFRTALSARNTIFQNIALLTVFVSLAIPLGFSLQQIAWETNAQRIVRDAIRERFEGPAQLDALEIDFSSAPMEVSAIMFTPVIRPDAEGEINRALRSRLGRPVALTLTQTQTETGAGAAQRAQLSATRAREEAANTARLQALATRLSLAAGVPETEVLIDRNRRRALVRSRRLGDAGLDAYRTLEQRIAVTEPEWTIELIPPMGVLPANIPFGEDGPNARGSEALAVIGWAAQRLDRAVVLSGDPDATEQAAERLREQGVRVELLAGFGPVRAQWAPEGE
ncbi:TIGR00341 family protein [Erythrobacter sanguineus]|uniref:TIGR00341 family protein n=1 Tax=Erythrobacter sanguineus TaxID=198312 RepID=A0A1M7STA7_9SPHN|nr:TIGR00341 family protein [Erythrobacter sanguineus]SHN61604.1 TIGR00341 family protein [Erythrobacter sanguineus]